MKNLPSINYKKQLSNPTIESDNSFYELAFDKDEEYFSILENFVSFVKNVEREFRNSVQYKKYIAYLKNDIGLECCQIHSNIKESDTEGKVRIEMHHGPCLTLFDLACIIVDYLLKRKEKINTFKVCKILSEEHFNNNVQVVMLSKTDHELVHTRDIFLHYNQGFGNLTKFLKKYRTGISQEILFKLNKYIELCKENDYFDNEILKLNKNVKKWNESYDIMYYD